MASTEEKRLLDGIRGAAIPINEEHDYDALMDLIGDARFVLLGESTHGTHEFYAARAAITMRLIREKDFSAVAGEADWPDAYRVNRYVRGMALDRHAIDALADFTRFPAWMWRNTDVLDFIGELREHNTLLPAESQVGFYGLDLYSLYASIEAVIAYLEKIDPEAAKRARFRYSCFERFNREAEEYGLEAALDIDKSCREEAVAQLRELQRQSFERIEQQGFAIRGELFHAQQNARLVQDAGAYYRGLFSGHTAAWNLRDRHMADTLTSLAEHFDGVRPSKIVVWEHNSHVGDARASEASAWKQLSLGQLIRERYKESAMLIGFTTYHGTVSAASDWGEAVERKVVRNALPGSYEDLLHRTGMSSFYLPLRNLPESLHALRERKLERAIGVVYQPGSERASHYFHTVLPDQFDAVIHFDRTTAVEPLDYTPIWEAGEIPETYPMEH